MGNSVSSIGSSSSDDLEIEMSVLLSKTIETLESSKSSVVTRGP
jgi:hypothetical protein